MLPQRLTLSLLAFCVCVDCAKILGIFPMPAPSHFFVGFRLMKELADRGHEVSVINPYPRETPIKNYRDVSVKGIESIFAEMKLNLINLMDQSHLTKISGAYDFGNAISDYVFNSEPVQGLLKSDERFDLVIVEDFLIPSLTAFSVRFNAPFIYVSAVGASVWNNNLFGNTAPASYIPHHLTSYTSRMNFLQRLYNLFLTVFDVSYKYTYFYAEQNKILHKYMPEAPQLEDIVHNATLILLNSHTSVTDPVPHLPNMIQIGGFHVDDSKQLPKDLKRFLDDAKEGVIYFSMGSNLRSADLHVDKRNAILKAFGKLEQKVLWKFEGGISNLPSNVKIDKWLPQSAILGHPNVRAFISHGGMLSNLESVYHGVPIIGIPIFGDQQMNVNTAAEKGYAICLPYHELSEETLFEALNEIIYNKKYEHNVKQRSRLLRDQPLKPIDTAVYWVEYAIRSRGSNHFRSAALDLPWYKLYMWDITVFLTVVLVSLVFTFYKVAFKIYCVFSKSNPKKKLN